MNDFPINIKLAQINPTVGDIDGNAEKILSVYRDHHATCDLIIFPELCLSGYQPEDLVLHPKFNKNIKNKIQYIEKHINNDCAILIGSPDQANETSPIYNAAFLIYDGKTQAVIHKHHLPNYGVFDEVRTFARGELPQPITYKGMQLGIAICEDFWLPDVAKHLKSQGADILISLNGSPFEGYKQNTRQTIAMARVSETGLPLIYVNQVGGQDDLVYDGASFVMDANGTITTQLPSFEECVAPLGTLHNISIHNEQIYKTLCLGLKDYIHKNNFPGVVLGLSGGIDSALSAAIAVDALGADRVHCVMMPSPYTSQESLDDARLMADNLGCRYDIIPIEPAMQAYDTMLNTPTGITAENIQSRARGLTLMAISNRDGNMVLTTGNKSEMAVGYATIYGDMCGGFNCLKDVYKTQVYDLARWRNDQSPIIPENIITRAPSAELRPDQTDQDSLPPYEVLDAILADLIEHRMGIDEIVAKGFDQDTVERVYTLLTRNEYKRRQSAPGVKITSCTFGRDRRMPITNRYQGN